MSSRQKAFRAPSECPVCGAAVEPNARACRECGADERSGWNEETTRYDGLNLPEEAFESDEPGQRKIRGRKAPGSGVPVWAYAAGAVLLIVIVWRVLHGGL